MVDTKQLNNLVIGISPAFLDVSFQGNAKHLAFAQCGVSVMELNTALEARHLSLPTSVASNGQTICGAVSTGTHGSAHAFGAMQEFIAGLHIVAEAGKHYWIERASQPVVNQAFSEILGGEKGAFVRFIYKRPFMPVPHVPGNTVVTSPGGAVMGLIGTLSDAVPHLIPAALDAFLPQQFKPTTTPILGSHGQIFGATEVRGHAMSTEIGVALQDAVAAEAIVAVAHDHAFAAPVALRYVKASSATLAFTYFAPITCTIELLAVGSQRTAEAYRRIWAEFDRRSIPYTLHWGQCLRAEATFIRQSFGERVDA